MGIKPDKNRVEAGALDPCQHADRRTAIPGDADGTVTAADGLLCEIRQRPVDNRHSIHFIASG